ncbi:hypothetical protein ILUMI_09271 [Ignelater luminosus]|uniref:Kazal-like domain-containing protein n=1 Tax=Ignelater luminosus TaxID=2038154 RepID=A0A8K0GG59_IGNLU|nr:hypothetical protein ILUMI_09271 [Ignelater luminosus]
MAHLTFYLFVIVIAYQTVSISSQQVDFGDLNTIDEDNEDNGAAVSASQQGTLSEIDIERCIARCQTLPQYDPICATDGVSYHNVYKLRCAQQCGRSVQQLYRGTCRPSAGGK